MRKIFSKATSLLLCVVMIFSLLPSVALATQGDPKPFLSVANKIDVALAVGKTNINYFTFEADLRAALKWALRADGLGPDSGGGSITMG